MLRWVDYRLRLLYWAKTEDAKNGRNRPVPPPKLKYARERAADDAALTAKASAWERRQALRGRPRE